MNTLILKLAEQAGSTHKQNLGVYQFYSAELEQFAHLIVEECVKMIENEASQYSQPTWAFELVNNIKDRFDVDPMNFTGE